MNMEEYIVWANERYRSIRNVKPGDVVQIKTYLSDSMVNYKVVTNDRVKERIDLTYGTNTKPKVSIMWQNIQEIAIGEKND
jgi:hypothetical protein